MTRARQLRARAGVVSLALLAVSCVGEAAEPGILRAQSVEGSVSFRERASDAWRALRRGRGLLAGSEVRTGSDGTVRLAGSDVSLEIARAGQVRLEAADRFGVATGSVLAEGAATLIDVQDQVIARGGSGGHFRLDRRLSLRVASYEGEVIVTVPPDVRLPALREVVVAAGLLQSREPRPMTILPQDRWDVRFLGDFVGLERDVRSYRRGFDATYGSQATTAAFFSRFVPPVGADPSFVAPVLAEFAPSDVLLGLLFGLSLSGKRGVSLAEAFASVLALRRDGASWGLIAAEFALSPAGLLKALALAIARGAGAAPPGGSGGPSPSPRPSSSPTSSPSPSARPSPRPSSSPSPSPSPTPCSVVDQLLGGCPL